MPTGKLAGDRPVDRVVIGGRYQLKETKHWTEPGVLSHARSVPRFVVRVSFVVTAESLDAARSKVKQVIEHGEAVHGEIEWDSMGYVRRTPS